MTYNVFTMKPDVCSAAIAFASATTALQGQQFM